MTQYVESEELIDLGKNSNMWEMEVYGSHLSDIFEKPNISIEKRSISMEKPSYLAWET